MDVVQLNQLTIDELHKLKIELTEKIRNSTIQTEKDELIKQSRLLNDKIKGLKVKKEISHQPQKEKVAKQCQECGCEYEGGKTPQNRVAIVYCGPCRKLRGKDIIETIMIGKDGSEYYTYYKDANDAITELQRMKADVRLDLHKTLDTLSPNTKLPIDSVCCISFVGQFTKTRIDARNDIINRIKNQQIRFGVLVFKRGPKNNDTLCNNFHEIGSKAWVNHYLGHDSENIIFVDDSDDHVSSVKSMNTNINSLRLDTGANLIYLLKSHLSKDNDDNIFFGVN